VALEFLLIVPILIVLVFGIIDFGMVIYARQVVSEVSRVGAGSVFWRAEEYGYIDIYGANSTKTENLLNLLEDAGSPIFDDNATKWKIIVSKIEAEKGWDNPNTPWDDQNMYISRQIHRGELDVNSTIGKEGDLPNEEALPHLYGHLVFDTANQAPDKSELGVVEVFYKYEPITPLPNFIKGILQMDGGGIIIRNCKAFY
jgi:hypothetical protein